MDRLRMRDSRSRMRQEESNQHTMTKKRIILSVLLGALVLLAGFLFVHRDKFVYVGDVDLVEVDCAQRGEILDEVFERDQRIRTQEVPFAEFARADHRNQELVISLIEQCGMPTLREVSKKQMHTIWLVLQHAQPKQRKKYFPAFEVAWQNGDITGEQYALMVDRVLMDEGKPQRYGSQIVDGKLYKLENPESVNERRAELGMGPIEKYLRSLDIPIDLAD